MRDPLNAFLSYEEVEPHPALDGPLAGVSLAVKDIFDVAGYPTGCGNPKKLAESGVKENSAPAVERLTQAGVVIVGKTQTDELAFSLNGQNRHFPYPVNPACPERITGGSSSGSAAAVAGGLADLALGSDTGGSVRAPASFCGLFGIRPTHGRVPLDRVMPLAPSFDVPGIFARNATTFERALLPFLGPDGHGGAPRRVVVAEDAFGLMTEGREPLLDALSPVLADAERVNVTDGAFDELYWAFRRLQAHEAWAAHGEWIERNDPEMTPGVRERFEFGRDVSENDLKTSRDRRAAFSQRLETLLGEDGVLVMPPVPGRAPLRDMDGEALQDHRERALRLLCLAGLSGLPQVVVPAILFEDCPIGASFVGPRGSDVALAAFAVEFSSA